MTKWQLAANSQPNAFVNPAQYGKTTTKVRTDLLYIHSITTDFHPQLHFAREELNPQSVKLKSCQVFKHFKLDMVGLIKGNIERHEVMTKCLFMSMPP